MSFGNKQRLSEMSQKQSKKKRGQYQIILLNDDHNTFDHVINCMIDICGHSYYQAVQCATLTHGAKQCSIFVDSYEECESVWEHLYGEGLNVVITKYKKHV
jgi:ATP-dependent Clp protease adaptor protein ClpS